MTKHKSSPLHAEGRPSILSGGEARARSKDGGRKRKPKREKERRRDRGRGFGLVKWTLIVLLAGPALVILAYSVVPPPVTPLMLIRLLEGENIDYRWTPLERMSPHLARAAIASEDNLFCEHWGFDFEEFREIFQDWREGERPRGASTITMQTAKNILLWPHRHLVRKAVEAWLTPQIELLWSKRRIMEVYLNVAEMGPGIYGAEAAAWHYFQKPAAALRARDAALLVALLPSPRRSSPAQPSDYLNQRAAVIQRRVDQLGPMTACVSQ